MSGPIGKERIDKVTVSLTQDKEGYDAYRAEFMFEGKWVGTRIFTDVTHRRACEKTAAIVSSEYENGKSVLGVSLQEIGPT